MDKSFGSPLGVNSPFSPKTKQSATSRRSSLLSFRNQSKFNVSGRLNQAAQIILKTQQNTVESYGLPLPVLITETLTFADSNALTSARLSGCGWGWVVCGRHLLVWQYREPRRGTLPVTCYELTLPQTDLAHKAELVCVFTADGNQVPSCIGVSPEGVVRYWPSVAHDGTYVEEAADLHGQECDTLVDAMPGGCVLATTTCTVVLVQTTITGGRHGVSTRSLRGSGGWLGGISRRVTSLFFSAMPTSQSVETKLVGMASLGKASSEGGERVCVVAGLRAQLWELATPERLILEVDLQKTLRDGFLHAHIFPPGDPGLLDVFILDVQSWNGGLLLLTAANNMRSPQTRYALAHMCTDEETGAGQLLGFVSVQAGRGGARPGGEVPGPRLLATATQAMLYDRGLIITVSSVTPNDKPDMIDMTSNGDQLLGGGLCFGVPLFFSKTHGVISISSNDSLLHDQSLIDSPIASPRPSETFDGHLSLFELDPRAVAEASELNGKGSTIELTKAAFLYFMKREHAAYRSILAGLYPPGDELPDVDTLLDRTILAITTNLINDVPIGDPRWNQTIVNNSGAALGSSGSLQIALQIADKRRALVHFQEFLRSTGLWVRLGGVSSGGTTAPTTLLIRAHAERLAAAIALRGLQQQPLHQHVVDTIIQQVMAASEDEEDETGSACAALSPSDLFYKRVSCVERALVRAAHWCGEQDASGCAPPALTQLITKVNQVMLAVIQEVLKHRHQHSDTYFNNATAARLRLDPTTWTSSPRAGSLQEALRQQHGLSVRRARRAPPEQRATLRGQSVALAAAALEMAKERAHGYPQETRRSEEALKDYAKLRIEYIQPFVDDEEYEHALNLAEKFHDFDMLVLVCEKSNNRDKLYHYMEKFETMGFQQCAFRWFMSQGRGGQAALLKAFPNHGPALSQWLAEQASDFTQEVMAPEASMLEETAVVRTELLWLHELRAEKWLEAARTLVQLAEVESESVARMTIQSSLAKMCALAAEADPPHSGETPVAETLAAADRFLLLAEHHALPPAILAAHGLQSEGLRVMEPREIIEMFITCSEGLTEYDYSRALELCQLVGEAFVVELRRRVWVATLLADRWSEWDTAAPLASAQDKMFFRVVDAVHLLDCDLADYLVPLDDLLNSPELGELAEDKGFQYIMKVGYEHMFNSQSDSVAME